MVRWASLAVLLVSNTALAQTEAKTRVFMNGEAVPVYFNDGDTFRVLEGKYQGMNCRLGGFNTLETFGPVHKWGTWDAKELYVISKMATLNARRGVWHCNTTTFEKDTYGRVLWDCPDLRADQIRRGFAHTVSIDYTPADETLNAIQKDAQENKRGMWAHGVPNYVVSSLHSVDEVGGGRGRTYNRLVSTADGHSAKWQHENEYGECEWVCRQERQVPTAAIQEAVEELIVDAEIGEEALELGDKKLLQVVTDFAVLGYFGGVTDEKLAAGLTKKLEAMVAAKKLGDGTSAVGSCALYVVFERRYGPQRAGCLK
jgi:endonuclease YncB( thermonuclease family)